MVRMKSFDDEDGSGANRGPPMGPPANSERNVLNTQSYQRQQPPTEQPIPAQPFRPPQNFVEGFLTSINQDLLVSKTFYFFFFSAFGSLFPLLAVYFKQMGMNATQSGLLIGIRPLVEFISAPMWGGVADRFKKGKAILLCSLACWIIFTLSLAFVQPPAASCIDYNDTHHVLYSPDTGGNDRYRRSVPMVQEDLWMDVAAEEEQSVPQLLDSSPELRSKRGRSSTEAPSLPQVEKGRSKAKQLPPNYVVGKSPNTVEYTLNYNQERHTSYISPPFSSIVYKYEDVQEVFFLLLLLIVLGEYFSAPAITLADSATLSHLGEDTDNYGRQRMFGSLGWGVAMFFVGIALDHSTSFPNHPCGPYEKERNYTICFATFSVLMGCAFISATQLKFDYEPDVGAPADNIVMKQVVMNSDASKPITIEDIAPGIPQARQPKQEEKQPETTKSTVFAQTTRKLPEWFAVLRSFATVRYGAFLVVTWFMGFGIGLVFTFLFWHLQDLGGTPTLFGVASVINHVSEIFAYFFSFRFIRQIGHVRVLCIGLIGNVCRFLYISWLKNPWWVLPFEFIQGVTHAAVWAACCSYITQATPANLRSSAQGVLQGLHHGLGRGCGAVIGGIFVNYFGTQITFRGYGFACLLVLVGFVFVNYYRKDRGFVAFRDDEDEPHLVVEETSHLAPHGVPANPMARSLSKQNLGDGQQPGGGQQQPQQPNAGVTQGPGGFLGVPGGGNQGSRNSSQPDQWGYRTNVLSQAYSPEEMGRSYGRTSLAAAFNPKGIMAQAVSPDSAYQLDHIRKDFEAYKDVTALRDYDQDSAKETNPFTSSLVKTSPFAPQPSRRQVADAYAW
ncbi:major facilitator superfamily domain-containing protein 6 [Dermacentor andersoni]|uniref:major facilitator superfamily domain-containing protein 6 n=1 Tax=Dermacentor andersoni TaxID=34620 RepID=UPI002416E128|nr:major facilitator superfamily domain-containing protein 6-like [Dermacentor andersoni]